MSAVMCPESEAHHHAGAQVDHRGQAEPPLAGAQAGDVADELVGGDGAGEVAPHHVGPGLRVRVGGLAPEPVGVPGGWV